MSMEPGNIVEINFDSSSASRTSLKSHIYDVAGKRLILSQTSPPTSPASVRKPVNITYILNDGSSMRRFTVSSVISGIDDKYRLGSGARVTALIVDITGKPKESNLREGNRVRPTLQSAISLTIGEREYTILDISVSGIRFIQRFSDSPFKSTERLACLLKIDDQRYRISVNVIRVTETRAVRHIAAAFVKMSEDLKVALRRKILMMEREELYRRR